MKRTRRTVYILQYSEILVPAQIISWCFEQRLNFCVLKMFEGAQLPELHLVDMLVVTGIERDIRTSSFSAAERTFFERCLTWGVECVGINFGADILYRTLEGKFPDRCMIKRGWRQFPLNGRFFRSTQRHAINREENSILFVDRFREMSLPRGGVALCHSTNDSIVGFKKNSFTGVYAMPDITPQGLTSLASFYKNPFQDESPLNYGVNSLVQRNQTSPFLSCLLRVCLKSKSLRSGRQSQSA